MKKINLALLLGLNGVRARRFDFAASELEKKIHEQSPTARLMAEIYETSNQVAIKLGLDPSDLLWTEAFSALKNFAFNHKNRLNSNFWSKNQARILIASDGIISLNQQDLLRNLDARSPDQQNLENFRQALRREVIEKFNEKLPKNLSDNISEKLF